MEFRQISSYLLEQVPANKFLFAGIVPANKFLFAGTVPANKFLLAGTVLANKFLFAGTVPANNLFLSGILDTLNATSMHPPLNISSQSLVTSLPLPT